MDKFHKTNETIEETARRCRFTISLLEKALFRDKQWKRFTRYSPMISSIGLLIAQIVCAGHKQPSPYVVSLSIATTLSILVHMGGGGLKYHEIDLYNEFIKSLYKLEYDIESYQGDDEDTREFNIRLCTLMLDYRHLIKQFPSLNLL